MSEVDTLRSTRARDTIVEWIRSGRYKPGERLPSERDLSRKLGMAPMTIRRGLADLVKRGLVDKQPGVGNFVKEVTANNSVAVIFPDSLLNGSPNSPTPGLCLGGINDALNQRDYAIRTLSYRPNRLWEDAGEIAVENGIKGVLLFTGAMAADDIKRMLDTGLKIVVIGSSPIATMAGVLVITHDNRFILMQIFERLVELGHRRIMFARFADSPSVEEEEDSFKLCYRHKKMGQPANMLLDIPNDAGDWIDYSVLDEIFELDENERPTAIITADGYVAGQLFRRCRERHIRIPESLSIAARHDTLAHVHSVPLTAPDSTKVLRRISEIAAGNLARMLDGEEVEESEIYLKSNIKWTGSIGPVPDGHTL